VEVPPNPPNGEAAGVVLDPFPSAGLAVNAPKGEAFGVVLVSPNLNENGEAAGAAAEAAGSLLGLLVVLLPLFPPNENGDDDEALEASPDVALDEVGAVFPNPNVAGLGVGLLLSAAAPVAVPPPNGLLVPGVPKLKGEFAAGVDTGAGSFSFSFPFRLLPVTPKLNFGADVVAVSPVGFAVEVLVEGNPNAAGVGF